MRLKSKNGIADVIEVRHLRFVENDAVLEFAGVAHHHTVSHDNVFAHVTSAPDLAVLADPSRSFQDGALFDDCSATYKDVAADEWTAN